MSHDAAYYRAWRLAHPEYRTRDAARKRAKPLTSEQRKATRERARQKQARLAEKAVVAKAKARRAQLKRSSDPVDRAKRAERQRLLRAGRDSVARERDKDGHTERRQARAAELLFAQAEDITRCHVRPTFGYELHYPDYEDALATAILELYANRFVHSAVRLERTHQAITGFLKTERAWKFRTLSIEDEIRHDAKED